MKNGESSIAIPAKRMSRCAAAAIAMPALPITGPIRKPSAVAVATAAKRCGRWSADEVSPM